MDTLDLIVILLVVCAASGGYRLGLTARAASWAGTIVGFLIATRVVPIVVDDYEGTYQRLLLIQISILLGGALLGQLAGLLIGHQLRGAIPPGPARTIDRAAGALAGAFGVLLAFWLLLPAMARTPEWPADQARRSAIAGFIHDNFPEAPNVTRSLQQLLGPQVFEGLTAAPDLGAPPASTGLSPELSDAVALSTVKVEAAACGDRLQDGSGSVVAPGTVITNAHVVSGSTEVVVETYPDLARLAAQVVAFDPARDVAVLAVPGLSREPLALDDGAFTTGGVGAVFGHPRGGPLTLSPFEVGRETTATGRDIYDDNAIRRRVFFLASDLEPGDSGGALIDGRGVVVGMAFAIAPDQPDVAYALTVEEITPVLAAASTVPVDTGPCID
ncbi:MAG: MarP family serine protease [Acidimicrobiia bacterium]